MSSDGHSAYQSTAADIYSADKHLNSDCKNKLRGIVDHDWDEDVFCRDLAKEGVFDSKT